MIARIQKWGNSQGLRLSKELLANADIDIGDEVEIAARDGVLVVTPLRRIRGGADLRELVDRIPKDYKHGEVDWGNPSGKEVW